MTDAEENVVWFVEVAREYVNSAAAGNRSFIYNSHLWTAVDALTGALACANKLPPHLKAKHRGPIMSRLNKVRALARRAAA